MEVALAWHHLELVEEPVATFLEEEEAYSERLEVEELLSLSCEREVVAQHVARLDEHQEQVVQLFGMGV